MPNGRTAGNPKCLAFSAFIWCLLLFVTVAVSVAVSRMRGEEGVGALCSVLAGGNAEALLEGVIEIRDVLESDAEADHRNALDGAREELRGGGEAAFADEIADRDPRFLLEEVLEPRCAEADAVREVGDAHVRAPALLEKLDDHPHSGVQVPHSLHEGATDPAVGRSGLRE